MPDQLWSFEVSERDQVELERRLRSQTLPVRMVERARIILLSAAGVRGREIATRVGCSQQTVVAWRARYAKKGWPD